MSEIAVLIDYESVGQQANLRAVNNANWRQTFAFTYQAQPFVLAEYALRMQIRSAATADEVRLELSATNELLRKLSTNNKAEILVPAARMADVPAGEYVYDLILSAGAVHVRAAFGTITVLQGITR